MHYGISYGTIEHCAVATIYIKKKSPKTMPHAVYEDVITLVNTQELMWKDSPKMLLIVAGLEGDCQWGRGLRWS